MTDGWILIHRKIQENQIWANGQPFDMRSAWIDLLMLANHKDAEEIVNYKPVVIRRGQYLTSVRKLSVRWGWGNEKTLKYLRLLESLQMINRVSDKRRTLLTIVNYDTYQCEPNTNRTQTEHKPNTDRAQTKNVKNVKNNISPYSPPKGKPVYYPDDEQLDKAFSDFVEHRKKIKKPMSDRAVELAISRLNQLSGGDNNKAILIINQSIIGGWQGLFELKTDKTVDYNKSRRTQAEWDELEREASLL